MRKGGLTFELFTIPKGIYWEFVARKSTESLRAEKTTSAIETRGKAIVQVEQRCLVRRIVARAREREKILAAGGITYRERLTPLGLRNDFLATQTGYSMVAWK